MSVSNKTKKTLRNILSIFIIVAALFVYLNNKLQQPVADPIPNKPIEQRQIEEDKQYNQLEDIAYYIHIYGHLPSNFMTKAEAKKQGWESGALDVIVPGYSIGGDRFGNNEELLPEKEGRKYYECDIDTIGQKSRGAKRIVFSNDGLVYYTEDHYEHFTLLYGEE